MHTTNIGGARFHHNGDFSGHVSVVEVGPKGEQVNLANVPISDIEGFVAEKYRRETLTALEALDFTSEGDRKKMMRIFFNTQTMLRIG